MTEMSYSFLVSQWEVNWNITWLEVRFLLYSIGVRLHGPNDGFVILTVSHEVSRGSGDCIVLKILLFFY